MLVTVLQAWVGVVVVIMLCYAVRHWTFTANRMMMRQRPFYQDLIDNEFPEVSVIVPMHNEMDVARSVLDTLLSSNYPSEMLKIVPVSDRSSDDTSAIVHEYSQKYERIAPLYILGGKGGKPNALNIALDLVTSEIVLVFDADYTPGVEVVRELVTGFIDPQVGAVMGRVVPRNTGKNLLTRLLSLERSGGYQVDQQARYNLDLLPQYGGTVGGFRKSAVLELGGFDAETLAEDTDLTMRMYIHGWTVAYANRVECYEEVPGTWSGRFTQLRRWSRGHNRVLSRRLFQILGSRHLTGWQRVDAVLLLGVYAVPMVLMSGFAANLLLFLMGALPIWSTIALSFFLVGFNSFGNFAPVFQIGAAELIDGSIERLYLLPFLFYLFLFNSWSVTSGLFDVIGDALKRRSPLWAKTARAVPAPKNVLS